MNKTIFIALSLALGFWGSDVARATERLYSVTADNIASYQQMTVMRAFNGVFDHDDSSSTAIIDLREPMHITKMLFHGRNENEGVSTRMRGAIFYVSNDRQNWTSVYQVPNDFTPDDNFAPIPCAFDSSEKFRYVHWANVGAGSMDEFQVWVDSTSVQVESFELIDYSASTITVSASAQAYGDVSEYVLTLKVAMAASDLGDDIADWIDGGTVTTLGTAANGEVVTADVPVPAANQKYFVRLFATAGDATGASAAAKEITPYNYKSYETLFHVTIDNLIDVYSKNGSPINCFDGIFNNDDTAVDATVDLGKSLHITRILYHGRQNLETRLIGRQFKVSNDNENWTVIYTVPLSFTYDANACTPTYWFPPQDETYRYVRWENVEWGSMDEFEIYVDSSTLSSVSFAVDDYSSTNLAVTGAVSMYGPISESGCDLYCAAAATDLGDNLGDWRTGGVVTSLGKAYHGIPLSASVLHLGDGVTANVRLFAVAGDLSIATPVKIVTPCDYALFNVTAANVIDADTTQTTFMHAFDGILDQTNATGGDSARHLTLDLKALYPIARLKFYDRTELASRMRGATFSVSKDGSNWTPVYTVPFDYNVTEPVGTWIPWPSGDSVCTGDNLFRFIKWEGVEYGSISEFQVYAGAASVVILDDFSIDSATSSALQLSGTATIEGTFATSNITFYAAYAASDLGDDIAAWQAGGTVAEAGSALPGETFSGSVSLSDASGRIFVRVFASLEGKIAASPVKTVMIRDCVEIRPLVESADSILPIYSSTDTAAERDNAWLAFDSDPTTLTTSDFAALDLGRPVRIDRITMSVDPENIGNLNGLLLQGSNDGFNWDTMTSFAEVPHGAQTIFDLAEPYAARYVRFFNFTSGSLLPARIYDLRFYTLASEQAHPAITNEIEISRSANGINLSASLAANGTFSGTAHVIALCATSDLGAWPADWTNAQDVVSIDLGDRAAGTSFTTTVPPAAASGLNVARLLVETPAGAFLGAPHFFTPNNEILIPITVAQVEAMTPQVNGVYAEHPDWCASMAWHHTFFGDGILNTTSDTPMPTAASLRKRYKITRAELYPRVEGSLWIMERSNGATVYVAPEKTSGDWTQDSAWTSFATAYSSVLYNGWLQLVGTPTIGYHLKVDGGQYGNYFLRFWGVPMDEGTVLMVR